MKVKLYKSRVISALLVTALLVQSLCSGITVFAQSETPLGESSTLTQQLPLGISTSNSRTVRNPNERLRLWYNNPAKLDTSDRMTWQSEVLPIGNGYMGGLVFGGVEKERIHFNEKSMWTGGPAPDRTYNGANRLTNVTQAELDDFLEKLDDKSSNVFGMVNGKYESDAYLVKMIRGTTPPNQWVGMGMYQDFGDVYLDFAPSGLTETAITNYQRDLDMNTAIASVSYDYNNVNYRREYFNSYPDNIMVMELSASEAGKLSFDVSMAWATTTSSESRTITSSGDIITLVGIIRDNKLEYEAQTKVINTGGTLVGNGDGTISVTNADSVTIVMACGTDYKNEYPNYRGEHPHEAINTRISNATQMGYDTLLQRHLEDYQELFHRVSFDLGGTLPTIPTNELIENYRAGQYNRTLEEMSMQYGRYLSIATSREGTLPSNLNGVWMIGGANQFWNADYHMNVNFQMNYWPNMPANLAETSTSLNDYIESIRIPGRVTAHATSGVESLEGEANGFMAHTVNNIFGVTGPYHVQEFGWNIGGSSWIMQNVYDYYRYTGDTEYLEENIYPMVKEMATFWEKYLRHSDYQDRLVVSPSVSAEQGPTVNGSTYDQSLAWQVFEEAIEAAEILGVDADRIPIWREKQAALNPIIIGDEGQVKEWYEETTIGKAQAGDLPEISIPNFNAGYAGPHRHLSHLVGLYPGNLISKETPEDLAAAVVSLEERGMLATGWSKAHKINLWARTGEGEKAYEQTKELIGGGFAGLMTNMLNSHGQGFEHKTTPVFQIEGNFGLTAGIIEMLMQSQLGYTQFLPALPAEWGTGHISGIVSRGNFEITMDWKDEQANYFAVTSNRGGEFIGEYKDVSTATISDSHGNLIDFNALNADKVSFDTDEGETYYINFTGEEIFKFPVNGVGLNTNAITLYTGETASLLATVTPVLASNKSVTWASSDPTVATVDTDGNIVAITEGTTVITVTTTDGGFVAVANITVQERPVGHISVTNVTVSPGTLTLDDGEHSTLVATVQPDNATDPSIVWHSEDAAIVSVDATGNITAHSSGTVKVIATAVDGGKFGIAEITVKGAVVIPEPEPKPEPEPTKNSSGSGGRSSKGTQVLDKSPNITGSSISQAKPLTAKKAKELFNELLSKNAENKSSLNLKLTNYSTVNQDVLKELKDSAEKSEIFVRLLFDRVENNSVITRLSVPTSITNASLNLTENSLRAERIKAMFGKYFTNKLSVLSLNQTESFSEPIEIIHKLPADLNNSDIVVYSYSLETNTYALLQEANVFVDANGYIHFTTSRGGNFIFSQGVFTK